MALTELKLQPGVWRNGSQYEAKGRYYDAQLVRWHNGRLRPVGGWQKTTASAFTGTGRNVFPFADNSHFTYVAIGTNSNAYVYANSQGSPTDITISDFVAGNETGEVGKGFGVGPFDGTADFVKTLQADDLFVHSTSQFGSTSSDFTSYFAVNDIVTTSGFNVAGNNLSVTVSIGADNSDNSTYFVVTAVTSTRLTVKKHTAGAGFTDTFDTTPLTTEAAGASSNPIIKRSRRFGNEDYDKNSSLVTGAATWDFDMWGEHLIGCCDSDGRIFYWNPGAGSPYAQNFAVVNAGAPTACTGGIVTSERHMMAYGAGGNTKKIAWCTQEDYSTYSSSSDNAWYPAATNTAGDFLIETPGDIKTLQKVGDRILVLTDLDAHVIDYVGPPYVYGRRKSGSSCGIIGRRVATVFHGACAWMGKGSFFMWDGAVRDLNSDVAEYVFDDINEAKASHFFAFTNSRFDEVWWFYASSSATENDRYVIWNFRENGWSIGQLERTAMADQGVFDNPIGISTDSFLYNHEVKRSGSSTRASTGVTVPTTVEELSKIDRTLSYGLSDSSETAQCYVETGPFESGRGDRLTVAKRLVTDSSAGTYGVRFRIKSRLTPEDTETTSSIYDLQTDGYTDIREQGRQMSLKIESPFDQDWEIGSIRADISQGGAR